MSTVLCVENLCKQYPGFALENVSFSMQPGKIMGFIGRNGAGKTTTLKCLMGFVKPDAGGASFFGVPFAGHESESKQQVGFALGGVDYYPKKKLRAITAATRRFYPQWDENAYKTYLTRFSLDENKTPEALSAGMRVKYALALALSHHAKLLLLDEPTSGLDPVSREDLLDVLLSLADEGVSILFSTHITSDLEKCADDITYLQKGRVLSSLPMEAFRRQYALVHFMQESAPQEDATLLGVRRAKTGATALVRAEHAEAWRAKVANGSVACEVTPATLEEIMVHLEQEADHESVAV